MRKDDVLKNLPKGFSEWKLEESLRSEETIKAFLTIAKEERGDDASYMTHIFEVAARARDLNAKRRTKGEKIKPTVDNFKKLAADFGYRLTFEPIPEQPQHAAE